MRWMPTAAGRRQAMVLGAILVLSAMATPVASAQTPETHECTILGRSVRVPAGQVVKCPSLIVVGGDLAIDSGATVTGDVKVALGDLTVAGVVAGDVWANGDLEVPAGGSIAGDASVTGDASVGGTVDGALFAGGDVALQPAAVVDSVSAGGTVTGTRTGAQVRDVDRSRQGGGTLVGSLVGLLFAVFSALLGALVVAVAPSAVGRVRDAALGSTVLALVVGALAWTVALILAVPLILTVIGALALFIALAVALCLGWAALSEALGSRLLRSASRPTAAAVGGGLLGVAVMLLVVAWLAVGSAPVICLALMLLLVLWTWGLGASLLTLFGARSWPRSAVVAAPLAPSAPLPPAGGSPPALTVAAADAAVAGPEAAAVGPEATLAAAALAVVEPEPVVAEAEPGVAALEAVVPESETNTVDPDAATADLADLDAGLVDLGEPPLAADETAVVAAGEGAAGAGAAGLTAAVAAFAVAADVGAVPPEVTPAPDVAAATQDVRAVSGVSPVYAFLLREGGIHTVGDLAAADPGRLREALSVPGVTPPDGDALAAWIESAEQLVRGS